MIIYVHSAEIYDRGRTFGRHRGLPDVRHITISPGEIMDDVARKIIQTAGNLRSIWLLIFNSHGMPSHLNIGTGLGYMSVYELEPVRPYMTPGGRGVELHSCNVAADHYLDSDEEMIIFPIGEEFMKRMASVLNCNVRGSTKTQAGYQENFLGPLRGADDYGRFEGGYTLVGPAGRVSRYPRGGRTVGTCGL